MRLSSRTNLSVVAMVAASCGGGTIEGRFDRETAWDMFLEDTYREDESGIFVVDGDTPMVDVKHLREYYFTEVAGDALTVARRGGVDAKWSDSEKRALTYCVSTTFGSGYDQVVRAMAQATADWEAAADVEYQHLSEHDDNCNASNGSVLFDVRPTNSGGRYWARAFFPGQTRRTRNVLIDVDLFSAQWAFLGTVRHELGHTLGFRHEHTRPESGACYEDNSWRPVTPYDAASIMHYPECNGDGLSLELTALDRQGVRSIYGAPGQTAPAPSGTPRTDNTARQLGQGDAAAIGPYTVVPGSSFVARLSGTGDADLYVRFGGAASLGAWDCRPYLSTADEVCTLTVPSGETSAHVMVHAYSASSFDLTIDYVGP
jgi:serine protease